MVLQAEGSFTDMLEIKSDSDFGFGESWNIYIYIMHYFGMGGINSKHQIYLSFKKPYPHSSKISLHNILSNFGYQKGYRDVEFSSSGVTSVFNI